jgi:hypothetical protein
MKILAAFTILLFQISFFAEGQLTWQKRYDFGSIGTSIRQTNDGNFIVLSYRNATLDSSAVYLVKINGAGDTLWTSGHLAAGNFLCNSIEEISDSGFIITGTTNINGTAGFDFFLLRTDSTGNMLWAKTYGGNGFQYSFSVQETHDGGFIFGGLSASSGLYNDYYIIKTDAYGDTLWTRTYGGTMNDVLQSVQECPDKGFILLGYSQSFGAGGDDMLMVKADSIGNFVWAKVFGGSADEGEYQGSPLAQTTDNGFVVLTSAKSFGATPTGIYLLKMDSSGNIIWHKLISGNGAYNGFSIVQTPDTGYIITGSITTAGSKTCLIKTNSVGDTLWTRVFGDVSYQVGYSVQPVADSGYIISGWTNNTAGGLQEIYIIKTDANGNSVCDQSSPGATISNPPTIISNVQPSLYSANSFVLNLPTSVVRGCNVTSLCQDDGVTEQMNYYSITIYPNPADKFTVISSDSEVLGIEVFNTLGERAIVQHCPPGQKKINIDLSELNSGFFLVKAETKNGSSIQKILKH